MGGGGEFTFFGGDIICGCFTYHTVTTICNHILLKTSLGILTIYIQSILSHWAVSLMISSHMTHSYVLKGILKVLGVHQKSISRPSAILDIFYISQRLNNPSYQLITDCWDFHSYAGSFLLGWHKMIMLHTWQAELKVKNFWAKSSGLYRRMCYWQ